MTVIQRVQHCVAAARVTLVAGVLALLVFAAPMSRADPLAGALEIQSAFVNVTAGVYQLHVRIRYPLNDELVGALRDGVTLSYKLDVEVLRSRRFWTDAGVAAVTLQRQLSYHSVSERYVVRDPLGGGEQKTYSSLEEALSDLGAVEGWPILVASQVAEEGEYTVRVRAGVSQGRLTDALRVLMFWSDDWQRQSEWYAWSLPR